MKRTVIVVALLVGVSFVPPVVAAENEAPLVDAGLDQRAEVGETVLLDATGSRDPDGRIESYEWRIETPGGATVTPADPTDPRTRFVVRESGRYDVTVTVTDRDGATASDTLYVYANGSGDPDSEPETSESSSGMTVISTSGSADRSSVAEPADVGPDCPGGARHVGGFGCLGVDPEPWIDVSGPGTVEVGETAAFGATVGGFDSAPTVTWTGGDSGRSARVVFESPGSYTVTAYGSDGEETVSDSASVRVVRNEPPTVDIRAPERVEPGETITLSAEASDPDGRIVDEAWSPGRTVVVPEDRSRETVTVMVYDDDGATAQDTIAVTGGKYISKEEPTQVKCAPKGDGRGRYRCEIDGELKEYTGREWADQATEWEQSNEFELDEVSSDHLNSNADLVREKPEHDLPGEVALRYLSDHTVLTQDNSVTKTGTQETADIKTTMEPHTQNGKTVSSDLTGDGEIDAVDWEERYGKLERNTMSSRRDAKIVKQRKQAKESAMSGDGETVAQSSSHSMEASRATESESSTSRESSDSESPVGADFM